jgi:hypothetical protein
VPTAGSGNKLPGQLVGNRVALMYLLVSLRKYYIKAALIAPTQLANSLLNKSVLP